MFYIQYTPPTRKLLAVTNLICDYPIEGKLFLIRINKISFYYGIVISMWHGKQIIYSCKPLVPTYGWSN